MASSCIPSFIFRRRIVAFRTVVATIAFTGAAGVSALMTSGCAVSAARAQSAPQASLTVATSQPAIMVSSQNSSSTQALLHQANTSFHAHDWLGALLDYQQVYYLDPERGRPDDQGLGGFAQARMSLCHTWTGVNDLDGGDYAAAHNEMQEALNDDPSNAVAQRMIPRIEQQYRLITAVDDFNQRFRDVDSSGDPDSALDNIRSNSLPDCARQAVLAGGTRKQQLAAFSFLRYYEDAFLINRFLNANVGSLLNLASSTDSAAATPDREDDDQQQMALAIPHVTDMARFAFCADKMVEVNGYGPVLDERRAAYERQQQEEQDAEDEAIAASMEQERQQNLQDERDALTHYAYKQMIKSDPFSYNSL